MMQSEKIKIGQWLGIFSVFLIPFYIFRFELIGIKTNLFEIITLIAFVYMVFSYASDLTIRRFLIGPPWIYLFLLGAIIGLTVAEDKTHAMGILKGWFLFPIILQLVILNSFNRKDIVKLVVPCFASLLLVSIWAIMQKISIITTLFYQVGDESFRQYLGSDFRAFGPFESPNYLAMFLIPSFFLSLPIVRLAKSKRVKNLLLISFALPVLALYFSTSRGGAVALASSALAFLLFLYFKSKVFKRRIEGLSNIFIFGFILAATLFLMNVVRIISPNDGGDSIRFEIYNYSFILLKEHFLFGLGLGSFQDKIAQISQGNAGFQQFGLSYALHPHNLYLALLFNLGLTGFIAFCVTSFFAFRNLLILKRDILYRASVFSALIAILIHGLFDTTYFKNDLSAMFLMLLALSFILNKNASEERYQ